MDNLENFSTFFFSFFYKFSHFAHLQHPLFLRQKNPKEILSDFQVQQFIILYIKFIFYWTLRTARILLYVAGEIPIP